MRECRSFFRTALLKSAVLFGCCAVVLLAIAFINGCGSDGDSGGGGGGTTYHLPDSDQKKCYQGVPPYGETSCAGTGQDGAYSINPLSYTDNGTTVTDNNTGLIWQKQDDGLTRNWYQASGTHDATYNSGSTDVCGSLVLGGYSDWRLPTSRELMSIVDYEVAYPGPTISTSYFPGTHASYYWSSTSFASDPGVAWSVSFYNGHVYAGNKGSMFYVRCVRGGQSGSSDHFDDLGDTVLDKNTTLEWQQDEAGAMTWASALTYCEGLSLGGVTDWRLPNSKELESLVDATKYNPAIDTFYFPGTHMSLYWSSTSYTFDPDYAWYVYFSDGGVYSYNKFDASYVRCVRGGQ